jgi:hypothetical protein
MSELITRLSPYRIQLPSESYERLPSETERKLWLAPELADVAEYETQEPDLITSWRHLKRGFGSLHERIVTAQTEIRAVGRLAILDITGASLVLDKASLNSLSAEDTDNYQPHSFMERVRLNAEDILCEKRYIRRKRIRETKNRTNWTVAVVGAAVLTGYLSDKFAEYLAK